MEFVNLTPHAVRYLTPEGVATVPPSGTVARLRETLTTAPSIAGAACCRVVYDGVEGLPPPRAGAVYIVSALVIAADPVKGRTDVVAPGTGPAMNPVRDARGQIDYVTTFVLPSM